MDKFDYIKISALLKEQKAKRTLHELKMMLCDLHCLMRATRETSECLSLQEGLLRHLDRRLQRLIMQQAKSNCMRG